jgi:hypothetical protein
MFCMAWIDGAWRLAKVLTRMDGGYLVHLQDPDIIWLWRTRAVDRDHIMLMGS